MSRYPWFWKYLCRACGVPVESEKDAEIARLTALVKHEWDDTRFMSAGPDYRRGGFEIILKSPLGLALGEFLAKGMRDCGAENYVEIGASHPDYGDMYFTCQRVKGKTPATKAAEAGARAAAAERELAELRASIGR